MSARMLSRYFMHSTKLRLRFDPNHVERSGTPRGNLDCSSDKTAERRSVVEAWTFFDRLNVREGADALLARDRAS